MGRLTERDRAHNEAAVRAAMDRLLTGDLPADGRCDLIRRRDARHSHRQRTDPRDARLTRLAVDNEHLPDRLAAQTAELAELRRFRDLAISRLDAQHDEIRTLRRALTQGIGLSRLRPPRFPDE